ncbi:MAG: SpoIIE family protein phosphatase [Waddliaceae bacterium]
MHPKWKPSALSLGSIKPLRSFSSKVLLVDDQKIIGKALNRMLKDAKGISFFFCSDPSEAIDTANAIFPTVILLDLIMPDIDGLTLLRYFRVNPITRDVPILILSGREDPETKALAFAQGANDYLIKLPEKVELIARIRYHSAAYVRLLERNQAYSRLEDSKDLLKKELQEAADFVYSMLPNPTVRPFRISWEFIPSESLGGDAFGYHWIDNDHLAVYLLDVCGHGVGAALLSVSILTILRFQQLVNVNFLNPKEVLQELSRVFLMREQNYSFFTLWYGVFSRSHRELVFSNGGHPPAILITGNSEETSKLEELSSQGPVIGLNPDIPYMNQVCKIKAYNQLFIFSDGVYEIEKKIDEFMDIDEFIEVVKKAALEEDDAIKYLLNYTKEIGIKESFEDDYSMIRVILP